MSASGESWLAIPPRSPFPLASLPFGVFSTQRDARRRIGVAIGAHICDAGALAASEGAPHAAALAEPELNAFLALGRGAWSEVRAWLTQRFGDARRRGAVERHLVVQGDATLHLPFRVADYVDFYASEQHATNLGRILRPGQEPLLPNWKHLPVGYHGRAGTIVVSGTEIVRPCGQRKPPDAAAPSFGPSERLDFEAEVGFVVGVPSALGTPIPLAQFREHVFGVCLVNDWSARDIQAFEYVPLGPFLGKSFATSISPWIVPLDALEAARVAPPPRTQPLLPHLDDAAHPWGLDLELEVRLNGHLIARPPFAGMYWSAAQMLAHSTSNGASLRTGDLFASGTVSGAEKGQRGSLIELSWGGVEPVLLPGGESRTFLRDGDEVAISASAPGTRGARIGLGEVRGRVAPAIH
ncbi:MAG TPA: fumarylacetoacetase [Myxococcota bacterium]|jgi:fumarylacetoacetase